MSDGLDIDQLADLALPLGRTDPDAVVQAAQAVDELVRRLNHATFHHSAFRYPSELYRTVSGLRSAVYGLDQTLRQLAHRLDAWATDPLVGHDHGGDPATTCESAAGQLQQAAAGLAAVTRPLDTVQSLTSHLSLDEPDSPSSRGFPPLATHSPLWPPAPQSPPSSSTGPGRAR
jgi:hypothetical protein